MDEWWKNVDRRKPKYLTIPFCPPQISHGFGSKLASEESGQ
jgi:hypothetical protein